MTNNDNEEARPVRRIPTKEQIEAARRQATREADPSYTGHPAGIHPEHRPYSSRELSQSRTGRNTQTRAPVTVDAEADYELEEGDEYYNTRPPTSTRRYQGYEISPEQVYQQGNTRLHVRYVDVPPRKSGQAQLPPGHERHTDEYEAAPHRARQRVRLHPLAWVGLFGVFLVLGWFGLNAVTAWYQGVQNDWTYGRQRHFEIDAVVGHGDSLVHTHATSSTMERGSS